MLDIDGFRAVNSNFGHQTGDEVLVDLAQMLKNNFRARICFSVTAAMNSSSSCRKRAKSKRRSLCGACCAE